MDRLAVERYKSLVRRQVAAITLAEAQTPSFHRCFTELGLAGDRIAETQIAVWLNRHNVVCSRRGSEWSPKTVGDRLFIDQRLQIERSRDEGLRILSSLTDEDDIYVFARWHVSQSAGPMLPPYDPAQCIIEFAEHQREFVDVVAWKLRGGRTFTD